MVTALASRLINLSTEEIPAGLQDALAAVCEFTEVDRGLVLSFSNEAVEAVEAVVTAEWERGALCSVADRFQNLPGAIINPWMASLSSQEGAAYVSDAAALEAAPAILADVRRRAGMAGFLHVPLRCGDRLLGVMALGTVDRDVAFTDDTAGLVQLCSEMFANSLDRIEKGRSLRMRTAEIQAVLDGTEDGLLVTDGQGHVVFASRRFGEILGFATPPARSMSVSEVVAAIRQSLRDPSQLPDSDVMGVPKKRTMVSLEMRDGRILECLRYALTLPESNQGVAWSFRDVTDRAELEGQLRQAQKLEAVGQLAGGIAHDFNNVLFTISSASELALLRAPDEQAAASFRQILASTQRAAALTRQLLAFSRKQVLNVRVLRLNDVIRDVHEMLNRLMNGQGTIRLDLGEPTGAVRADQGQIEQVLFNLVVNARDAKPKTGVTVQTAARTLSGSEAAQIPDLSAGPHVMLIVADDGEGMSEDVLARAFEPFFTTKEVGKGTGLGLATVFGIIKQHRGAIQAQSSPGMGTEFRIFLPRVEAHTGRSVVPADQELPPGHGESVLLVEDEAAARRMTADALRKLGYQVVTARDGKEALVLAEAPERGQAVDLLLTDFVLPHVNGAELALRLKQRRPDLPVVFMSGHAEGAIFDTDGEKEAIPFLQKPFKLSDLARTLRRLLGAGD